MGLVGPKRHTDRIGDISEAAIIARLLQAGYVVLFLLKEKLTSYFQMPAPSTCQLQLCACVDDVSAPRSDRQASRLEQPQQE